MRRWFRGMHDILTVGLCKSLVGIHSLAPIKRYQPIFGARNKNVIRGCHDRWDSIEPYLSSNTTVLDIGCNYGYFSFNFAKKKGMAFGVDSDSYSTLICNAVKRNNGIDNVFFWRGVVNREFLEQMPFFDTIFNFSVFHHWVKQFGVDEALHMMEILGKKCNTIFFESGQADERGTKWAKQLQFMGDMPAEWGVELLKGVGFEEVKVLGTFPTGLTKVNRYLFIGRR